MSGSLAGGITSYAGFMERRGSESCEGWVHFGSILQQQLGTLQTARAAGITERRAAVDGPHIHLEKVTLKFFYLNFRFLSTF